MKKITILLLAFFFGLAGNSVLAQQGAVFSKKVIRNMHQEGFHASRSGENSEPVGGSFRDYEGNFYIYGQYEGSGTINKIDNVILNGLNSESLILIKYDNNYKPIWGYAFGNTNNILRIKVVQGHDSNIYLFASSYENFTLGGLTVNKTTIASELSTYVIELNAQNGNPISGFSIVKDFIWFSWILQDAIVDKNGNIYVALWSFVGTQANRPDSIRFGNLSAVWRNKSKTSSNMAAIVKFDKNMNPLWLHSIGPIARATMKLSYVKDELIVAGHAKINKDQWRKIYFDDELLVDTDFNTPFVQENNGFILKIDSSGIKKWMWPWLMKYDLGDSPGIGVMDMRSDHMGNTYCFLFMGDLETKFNTTWFTPSIRTAPKMVKFNNEGILEWIKEPLIKGTGTSFYPRTDEVNCMFVDKFGNSYYSFTFTGNFEEFTLDSIYFSLPIKNMDIYWGLLKLDTDGNAVDAIFPSIADRVKKVSFNNSFKLPFVADDGTIYQPLTVRVYDDTMYVFNKDTLTMDFDSSRNMFLNTYYFTWNEITPKSQLIKEYSHPTCANSNNGYIHLKVIGGASGHYLNWSHGSSDLKLDNLGGGTYIVSLYDSTSQQTMIDTFMLKSPPPISAKLTIKDDTNNLSQGLIQLIVQGGVPPYTYKWNDPKNSTTASIDELASGSYSVTVTDYNNCIWDTNVTVNNITISIDEYLDELSVYPNPSKDGTVYLKMLHPKSEKIEVIVVDAKGQECFRDSFEVKAGGLNEMLPLKLNKGNYLIKVIDGKSEYLRKVSII